MSTDLDVSKVIRKSFEKRIERDDVVVQAAKIINPAAFVVCPVSSGESAPSLGVRRRYDMAVAVYVAEEILRRCANTSNLAELLVEAEVASWADLVPSLDVAELRITIEKKHRSLEGFR